MMEYVFSPWRMQYVGRDKSGACAFCEALKHEDGPGNLVLFRGKACFVIMNLYPYTSAHLMVVPMLHCSKLGDMSHETHVELVTLGAKAVEVIGSVYHPQGFNMGMNLGQAGGAGIVEHLHMHVVPRWVGDSNFMPVVGGTRVMPELLEDTYQKLKAAWVA